MRLTPMRAVFGLISNPMKDRLSESAAMPVVADPENGSHTRSPSFDTMAMICCIGSSACCQWCRSFSGLDAEMIASCFHEFGLYRPLEYTRTGRYSPMIFLSKIRDPWEFWSITNCHTHSNS